jgi:DNA polymerase III delta prime subunit
MSILEHLDKNNLHHAYLIEGMRDLVVPEILEFCESINIKTLGNPDFCHITIDNFKKEEAMDLRTMSSDKSFSSARKIFLICVNTFSLDAEGILLKMFEEPTENTLFFLVVPDINSLLKTLVSRFYFISARSDIAEEIKDAEKFIKMPIRERIDFIKDLLTEPEEEDEEGNEIMALDSTRAEALKFLNALEFSLHKQAVSRTPLDIDFFNHIFKVREFLRMPGSSTKSLMESVALTTPIS